MGSLWPSWAVSTGLGVAPLCPREHPVNVPSQAFMTNPPDNSEYFVSTAGNGGLMALGTLPVPFAKSKSHCALKKLCPSRCVPTGSCTGLPGCRRELWGVPGPQQPLWPPRSPWRRCAEDVHLGRQEEPAEASCALPFFPGIDSWAVEKGSSEGKSSALFHKGDNRNGFISRSGRGLPKGLGAEHTVLICV